MHLSDRGCDGEEIRSYGLLVVARILEGLAAEDAKRYARELKEYEADRAESEDLSGLDDSGFFDNASSMPRWAPPSLSRRHRRPPFSLFLSELSPAESAEGSKRAVMVMWF